MASSSSSAITSSSPSAMKEAKEAKDVVDKYVKELQAEVKELQAEVKELQAEVKELASDPSKKGSEELAVAKEAWRRADDRLAKAEDRLAKAEDRLAKAEDRAEDRLAKAEDHQRALELRAMPAASSSSSSSSGAQTPGGYIPKRRKVNTDEVYAKYYACVPPDHPPDLYHKEKNRVLQLSAPLLALSQKPRQFYERACYREVWEKIMEQKGHIMVTGTSGIGKTCFATYIQMCVKPRINDPTDKEFLSMVYQNGANTYWHQGTDIYFTLGADLDLEESKASICVIDPPKAELRSNFGVAGFVVMLASYNPKRYKDFTDEAIRMFMDLWTLDELLDFRGKIYPEVPEKVVRHLAKYYGPVPRHCVQAPSRVVTDFKDVGADTTSDELHRLCRQAGLFIDLDKALQLDVELILTICQHGGVDHQAKASSVVVHVQPVDDSRRTQSFKFASTHVYEEMLDRLRAVEEETAKRFIRAASFSPCMRGLAGDLFEPIVHRAWGAEGKGMPVEVQYADTPVGSFDQEAVTQKVAFKEWVFYKSEDWKDLVLKDGVYYYPAKHNAESFDSFGLVGDELWTFQITDAAKHPVFASGLRSLSSKLNALNTSRKKAKKPKVKPVLVFVVPFPRLAEVYKKQAIWNAKRHVIQEQKLTGFCKKVTQRVLLFPL